MESGYVPLEQGHSKPGNPEAKALPQKMHDAQEGTAGGDQHPELASVLEHLTPWGLGVPTDRPLSSEPGEGVGSRGCVGLGSSAPAAGSAASSPRHGLKPGKL